MDASEVWVLVLATALVIGILWFFFGPRKRVAAGESSAGVQEVGITVKGGYSPEAVVVKAGRPVRLRFFRDETNSCSDEVVLGDFGISRALPAHKTTDIEFTPDKPGTFTYTCGMGMMRGRIIVE